MKCARAGARFPLPIVKPAHPPIPPGNGYVFVNQRNPALAQHPARFAEHCGDILCVV